MPKALTKQAAASARGQAQERPADREGEPHEGVARGVEAEQERLEHEPLADEAVQEGQPGDGHGAQQEEARPSTASGGRGRRGARSGGSRSRPTTPPAPRKSRPLKSAWFKTWRSDAERARTARPGRAGRDRDHPDPGGDEDDADVLDAVVGEQALEVVLHQRVEHAQEHRDGAHGEDEAAPGEGRRAEAGHADAEDPVDAGLDQGARHQRRDRARRGGVRLGEPDVQRDHSGLDAEAREEEQEDRVAGGRRRRSRPEQGGEGERLAMRRRGGGTRPRGRRCRRGRAQGRGRPPAASARARARSRPGPRWRAS